MSISRILIATVQTPFTSGGAEIHAKNLCRELNARGFEAEIVRIPFKWYPPKEIVKCMLACRLMDLTESTGRKVDRLIGLRFPAYLIPHPNKVIWLLHQHRTAYELWGTPYCDLVHYPDGERVRQIILHADTHLMPEARRIYCNSANVAKRLKTFNGISGIPLYHPPNEFEKLYAGPPGDYIFYPSRLDPLKRQDMLIRAMALTRTPVRAIIAGHGPDEEALKKLVEELDAARKVELVGFISEDEKRRYYAQSLGVFYAPYNEDYGYVTLEAFLSHKPLITTIDSGGPLEFVEHGVNGRVAEPTPERLAREIDALYDDHSSSIKLGEAGYQKIVSMEITWDRVVEKLTED